MGMVDFNFCEHLVSIVAEHFRTCERCRSEALRLMEIPFIKMLLPVDLRKIAEREKRNAFKTR